MTPQEEMDYLVHTPIKVPPSALVKTTTMDAILELADGKGWSLAILYEMPGRQWHARFERKNRRYPGRKPDGILETTCFLFADTAHDALAKAYEETQDYGVHGRREHELQVAKWNRYRQLEGKDEPTPASRVDVKPLRNLLKGDSDLEYRLLTAVGRVVERLEFVNIERVGDDDTEEFV